MSGHDARGAGDGTAALKLIVSKNQRYTCQLCGQCCRRFRVRITPEEIARLESLDWGDEPHPVDFHEVIGGHHYFRRRPDGSCVFLDERGVCSIHVRFGLEVKALTCRGYPMNIVSVAPGELSVLARMDCPAVLSGQGTPLTQQQRDIMRLVSEMRFGLGPDERERAGLSHEAIGHLCRELHRVVRDTQLRLSRRVLWLFLLTGQLERLGASFINDVPTLESVWLNLLRKSAVRAQEARSETTLGAWERLLFRNWLALYCRRDEELTERGVGARLSHFGRLFRFIAGSGSWRELSGEHPAVSASGIGLLTRRLADVGTDEDWRPYVDFLVNRLDTRQFFGSAYYGLDFYGGLRALLLTYPLTVAVATAYARSAGRDALVRDDIFRAVLCVDHAHGRSPSLTTFVARYSERFFAPPRLLPLLQSLL